VVKLSQKEKLIQRLKSKPKDFTYDELCSLLSFLGYEEDNAGKTSGSAVRFVHTQTGGVVRLHKPHPEKTMKRYVINNVLNILTREGRI